MSSRAGPNQQSPSPPSRNDLRAMTRSRQHARNSVVFTPAPQVHSYPPAVWEDDEEVYDDDDEDGCEDAVRYEHEGLSLAEEAELAEQERYGGVDPDDWMSREEALPIPSRAPDPAEEQRRQQELPTHKLQQQLQQQQVVEQRAAQQHQQQRQQIEKQRGQQQITAQTMARQDSATSTQGPGRLSVRHQGLRERLILRQDSSSVSPSSSSAPARLMDPIDASGTKKISLTPLLVRDNNQLSQPPPSLTDPMLPSGVMQRQEEESERAREEIGALENAAHKTKQTSSGSREQLILPQDSSPLSPSSSSTSARLSRLMDPIDASGTKRISLTPLLVQDISQLSQAPPSLPDPMLLTSGVTQRQTEERKRTRKGIGALENAARNKAKQTSSGRPEGGANFRKEPQAGDDDISRGNDKKGKSGGLFDRLFDRRKDTYKEKGTNDSFDISWPIKARSSDESGRSSNHTDNSGGPQTPPRRGPALTNTSPPVSQHTSGLRQRDREQEVSPMNSEQGSIASTLSPTSDDRHLRPGFASILGDINGGVLDEIPLHPMSEPIPSSSGASDTNIPPHEASFELHGNSTATQLELTMQLLSEFLPPPITVVRTVELNGALKESLRRAQGMLNEYLHMVKKRDDWWRARLVEEQRCRAVLEQGLQSIVREGGVAERGLRGYLGRHTGIDSDISDWKGLATIQARPPTLPLEELGQGHQEHIQDTTVQPPSTRRRLFVTESTVGSGSLDAAHTASSFTTRSVVSSTSTPFMDTGHVNRDGARLLQTTSTSFTETSLQVR